MNGAFMDEDLEKEDAALPLVADQARQRLSGLNYPEASLGMGGSHAIELAARATASIKVSLGLLSGADASWRKIIGELRANPIGDNFDFSGFPRIVGVVCMPFVVYSDADETLAFVDGTLRACVSTDELDAWLLGVAEAAR
jgi:hypothetical protein